MSALVTGSIFSIPDVKEKLRSVRPVLNRGRVTAVTGPLIRGALIGGACGDFVRLLTRRTRSDGRRASVLAQICGFDQSGIILSPLSCCTDIVLGSEIEHLGPAPFPVGTHFLGAVVSSTGSVLRRFPGAPNLSAEARGLGAASNRGGALEALKKRPSNRFFPTGIRVIDAFTTVAEGQRMAIIAEPGVGKTTLLAELARNGGADVIVVGLIGERGREVNEFIFEQLDEDTRRRCATVVSTSDEPAAARIHAAELAISTAEYFRDQGMRVLLLIDSLTRLARAYRELGLAAGEPPIKSGYPPSLYAALPRLIERAGNWERGSITAFFTVLASSDIIADALGEEVESLVDGQIVLSREVAARGVYPAVDIGRSLSRLQSRILSSETLTAVNHLRNFLHDYDRDRELKILASNGEQSEKSSHEGRIFSAIDSFRKQERGSFQHLKSIETQLANLGEQARLYLSNA